tara:strand:- start:152 stop:1291 length:1140 start_codon:yes stop_codon:yes gene_type:complete
MGSWFEPVGNLRKQTMEEVWNDEPLRQMRQNMMQDKSCKECTKCYEQEESGFMSMRLSQNKELGHNIDMVDHTESDGSAPFKLKYYDIRFSNLCNLACRSCGDIFSSNWVKESKKYGWSPKDKPNVEYAGRYEMDMWNQMLPHIDNIQQIYFAGGEPLMMKEHYMFLEELIKRGRTDVRLIYNTNFTELKFKQKNVLDMWKEFSDVSIGASLDAMGPRAEIMRYGTKWSKVEDNRYRMLEVCPQVDFYISATLSVFNAFHVPDFHRDWADKGLIKIQDFNINILQGPDNYRVDIMPLKMKHKLTSQINAHIDYIKDKDPLNRASTGFKSLLTFLWANDNSKHIPSFVKLVNKLDRFRKEDTWNTFPELGELREVSNVMA